MSNVQFTHWTGFSVAFVQINKKNFINVYRKFKALATIE